MRRLLPCYVVLLLVMVCTFGSAHAQTRRGTAKEGAGLVRGAPLPRWAQPLAPAPETQRDDPVVFRLAETQSIVAAVPATLINRVIQVNANSALGSIGQFGIPYFPDYQKLLIHRVAIIRGKDVLDRTHSVNTRLLAREEGIGNGVYGGATTVQMLLDDVRVGDSLWYTYTVEGANPVMGKRWSDGFSWDAPFPVEMRRVVIFHPANRPVRWKQSGDFRQAEIMPTRDRHADLERIQFDAKGLDAVEMEPAVPADFLPLRQLQASEFANWQEVAAWADGLFPEAPASSRMAALAKQFAAQETKLAQASAALRWVQEEVRYFSVSIGENSHRPQAPDTVLQRRYGDCKDKSYLLVSLLKQLGIAARPVLVAATSPALPAKLLPSPMAFDHVIVRIELDGEEYLVDPTRTGEKGKLDELPTAAPGAQALLADRATQGLRMLPESTRRDPLMQVDETITVADLKGDATLEARMVFRAEYVSWARLNYSLLSARELRKSLLGKYEKLYPGVTLTGDPQLKDGGDRFEIVARYSLPKPVSHTGTRYQIDYESHVIKGTVELPGNVVRSFPLALPQGKFRGRYHLQIVWPDVVRQSEGDESQELDNAFFRVSDWLSLRGRRLDYLMDFEIKSATIAAKDVPEFQKTLKPLGPMASGVFGVPDSALARPDAVNMPLRDFDNQRTIAWLAEAAEGSNEALLSKENAVSLCDKMLRIRNFSSLLNQRHTVDTVWAKTLEGAKRAEAVRCKARLAFYAGEFEASVAGLQADALRPDLASPALLAWARLFAGDRAGALRDIASHVEARRKSNMLAPADLAELFALHPRAGEQIPQQWAALAGAADGAWPNPVLAMQLGRLSEEQLFATLDKVNGDEGEIALSEAWFYVAQRRFAAGDISGGKAALRWLEVNGIGSLPTSQQAHAEFESIENGDPESAEGLRAAAKGDLATAKRKYDSAAARGIAVAQYRLGLLYYYGGDVVRRDWNKALSLFEAAASKGYTGAMNLLGKMYAIGEGVKNNDSASVAWFKKAAESGGDKHGSWNLGSRYLYGQAGLSTSNELAFRYIRQAAQLGHPEAQGELAKMYIEGRGVAQSEAQAAYWARLSVQEDNPAAQAILGYLMVVGRGREQNVKAGLAVLNALAAKGNRMAQFYLGFVYGVGDGVEKNEALSVQWMRKAADNGYVLAHERLGLAYKYGWGVPVDLAAARRHFGLGAVGGSPISNSELGSMFENGEGGVVNLEGARTHYLLSAQLGRLHAQESLALMLATGQGGAADPKESALWYHKAAAQGSVLAMNNLAIMYANGEGVVQSDAEAIKLYRAAAALGYGPAMANLGHAYLSGKGTAPDPRLAYAYFRLAVKFSEPESAAPANRLVAELAAADRGKLDAMVADWKLSAPLPEASF